MKNWVMDSAKAERLLPMNGKTSLLPGLEIRYLLKQIFLKTVWILSMPQDAFGTNNIYMATQLKSPGRKFCIGAFPVCRSTGRFLT